jgi:hypothetical protein
MTPDQLEMAGRALFGQRWQADLADALGIKDTSRIRSMLTGARPIKNSIKTDIIALLSERGATMAEVKKVLSHDSHSSI